MTSVTPAQGAAVLLALGTLVALLVGAAHLLRPGAGPLLGEVPDVRTAGCEDVPGPDGPPLVRSATLVTCPDRFDGRVVQLEGEAVGDLLGRGTGRWVLLNDDPYAHAGPLSTHQQQLGTNGGIAVLFDGDQLPTALGGPGIWGDLIRVIGTFRATAAEDQGGPAVIAEDVTTLRPGGPVQALPATAQRRTAPALLLVAAALGVTAWRRGR